MTSQFNFFWRAKSANFLLYLVLAFLIVPVTIFSQIKVALAFPNPAETPLPSLAIEAKEIIEKRTLNAQVYETLPNQGYLKVSLGSLNYQADDSTLQPIENKIVPSLNSLYSYRNQANRFIAEFKDQSEDDFVNFTYKSNGISLDLENSQRQNGQVKDNAILYKEVLPEIDLNYTVQNDALKEEIVLKAEPRQRELIFRLKTLAPVKLVQTKESDLEFYSLSDNQLLWLIGRPSVINRVTGDPVYGYYTIEKISDSQYRLILPILDQFLPSPEIGYPVVIDPSITLPSEDESALAIEGEPDSTHPMNAQDGVIQVGHTSLQEARAFLKFALPTLPSGTAIDGAIFGISSYEERSSVPRIKLFRPENSWSANSLTWNNQPPLRSSFESSYTGNTVFSWWNYDITQLTRDWYNGSPNNGLVLKAHNPSVSRRNFYSKYISTNYFKPNIIIYYNNNPQANLFGQKDWWRYFKIDLPGAEASVNIANGNLVMNFADLTNDGRGFDTNISHTYNSQDSYDGRFGYNWTISANKRLLPSSDRKTVTYIDESGTQFIFNDSDGNGNYVEGEYEPSSGFYSLPNHRPNGLNWGLKFEANTNKFIAKSNARLTTTFDSTGKILEERDRNSNTLTYVYDQDKLINITDASGRKVDLNYDAFGRLSQIEDHNYNDPNFQASGLKVQYQYTGSDLTKVLYYTNSTLTQSFSFTYTNHRIVSFIDYFGKISQFNYDSNGRVTEVIDALTKKNQIIYLANDHSQLITAKGFEPGASPADFTTDFYYHFNPFFHTGLVYREISPPVKNSQGNIVRNTMEFDYNDDYQLQGVTDPSGAVDAYVYDDISGLLTYHYDRLKILDLKNTYNYSTYEDPRWNLLDSYDGNGVQTTYSYDSNGNLIRKAVIDGDGINLLHNPGFESQTRRRDVYDPICNFNHPTLADIADYWCSGGQANNKQYGVEDQSSYDGTRSQFIGYLGNTIAGSVNVYQTIDENFPALPDTDYTLSYQYKQSGNSSAVVQIAVEHFDARGRTIGSLVIAPDGPWDTNWRAGQFTFRTPNDPNYWTTNIYQRINSANTGVYSTAWFDAVKLEKGTTPSAQTEKYTTFTYTDANQPNPTGLPLTETTPEGKTISYGWDNHGNLLSITDSAGNVSSFTYDANGNTLFKTEPKGNQTSSDPDDFKTAYTYNGQNKILTAKIIKSAAQSTYSYNRNGNLSTVVSPNGLKTSYLYDAAGRLTETINPQGYKEKVEYDSQGNPKSITDPNSQKSNLTFDSLDRLENEVQPSGLAVDYKYDNNGNLTTLSDGTKTLNYSYDRDDKVIIETNNQLGQSKSVTYQYDRVGQVAQTTNTTSDTISYNYSATGEVTKVTAADQTSAYTYNKNNQIIRIDKPNSENLAFGYNDNAQVVTLNHRRGNTDTLAFSYQYDANGNRTRKVKYYDGGPDALKATDYTYDNQNQLIASASDQGATTYTYDKSGNLTQLVKPDSTTTFNNSGNRLVNKSTRGQPLEFFGYDPSGNLTSRDSGDRVTLLSHFNTSLINDRDRLTGALDNNKSPDYTAGKFSQALSLDSSSYLTYPSTSNFPGSYGTIEFWFQPHWNADSQTRTFIHQYFANNDFLKLQKRADNKLQLKYVRGSQDFGVISAEPISWQSDRWYHLAISWQPRKTQIYFNGELVGENSFCPSPDTSCYLTGLTLRGSYFRLGANHSAERLKDYLNGNFDELRISNTARTANEIVNSANAAGPFNLTRTISYEYDSKDLLTKVTKPNGVTVSYAYDNQQRLIKRSHSDQEDINYQYDGDKITAEVANDGTVRNRYLYDINGQLLSIFKNNQFYFPLVDGLGSLIKIQDLSGNTVSAYDYDDWGNLISKSEQFSQPFRYASYWYDDATGLYHLGARWYDPGLYRFTTVDPENGNPDDPLSLNEYRYANNNPIKYVDPKGDFAIPAVVLIAAAALNIGFLSYDLYNFKRDPSWKNAGWVMLSALPWDEYIKSPRAIRSAINIAKARWKWSSSKWFAGTFSTRAESLIYHFNKHGSEFGAKNIYEYTQQAITFYNKYKHLGKRVWSDQYQMWRYEIKVGDTVGYFKFGKIISFFKR